MAKVGWELLSAADNCVSLRRCFYFCHGAESQQSHKDGEFVISLKRGLFTVGKHWGPVLGPFFGGWQNLGPAFLFLFFLFLSSVAGDWNGGAPTQIIKITKTKEFPPLVFFFFRMAKTERLPLRFTTYTPFFNISRGHGVRSEFPDKAISCPI